MPVARLFRILTAIEAKPTLRPADLARYGEVSERTVYRDIEALKAAGVPIYFDKGYKLAPNFFLPPLKFSFNEAVALISGGRAFVQQAGTPYAAAAEEAVAKVLAALPVELRNLTLSSTQTMLFDAQPVIDYRLHSPVFDKLEQARREGRTVDIAYRSTGHQSVGRRQIDPYALLYRDSRWYLVAFCHWRRQVKMFRIDRIEDIRITSGTYSVPAGFSVEAYLGDARRVVRGRPKLVRVRFTGKAVSTVSESHYHPTQELVKDGDGVVMTVRVGNPMEMVPWIMGFGAEAEVIEPDKLRQALTREVKTMALTYHRL